MFADSKIDRPLPVHKFVVMMIPELDTLAEVA